jgi:hypothetical protein
VWHHLALLQTRLLPVRGGDVDDFLQGIADDETVATSLTVLAAVLVLSLVAGAWAVRARETRLSNAAG